MFGKKNLNLAVIVGENSHRFLSFDEYAEHFLLPFSPRFCNIDFAISTIVSAGIQNIVVFVKRDKDIIQNYLLKGWPNLNFTVFDYVDLKHLFMEYINELMKEKPLDLILIMKANYPVWFDMKSLKEEIEKSSNVAFRTKVGRKDLYSGIVVDRNIFIKKYEDVLMDESSLEFDIIEKLITDFKIPSVPVQGYLMPFQSLKDYYDIHISMLQDYLAFDQFNAYVPIRGTLSLNIFSNLGKGSYIINSIVGENVEISGKVENSIIFSNVKVGRNAHIKNSLILPGNHIGSNAQIINSIIDEYSEDNSIPNIEAYSVVGSENPTAVNQLFPDLLNFGITLIGKDIHLPASTKIGANCYIDSFLPTSAIREQKKLSDGESIMRKNEY